MRVSNDVPSVPVEPVIREPADLRPENPREDRPTHRPGIVPKPPPPNVGLAWGSVGLQDLAIFFRELGTMLHAGVGMVGTLAALEKQTADLKLKVILGEARLAALEGAPFSKIMLRYPDVFDPLMVSMVQMGEFGGTLERSVIQLADYIERDLALRTLIRRVTAHPKLVIGASIVIICFANWIISSLDGEPIYSPLTTWSTWVCLLPWILGVCFFAKLVLPRRNAKVVWDRFLLKIPYFGMTLHQLAMARFGRALSAMVHGGIAPHQAVRMAADCLANSHLTNRVRPAADKLEQGSSMANAFAQTHAFMPMTLNMVDTGETSGNLDAMLEKMAQYYEQDSEARAVMSARVLGVVAMILVGVYVGLIVVGFYVKSISKIGGG